MPCPFGYTAEDEDLDEEEEQEQEQQEEGGEAKQHEGEIQAVDTGVEGAKHSKNGLDTVEPARGKKLKSKGPALPMDQEGDPLSWFYANQIKCEKDFQVKKDELRKMARQRLDQLMDKKNQRMLWPSDSDYDDLSLSSGELSELDSDVHSLASVRSCAYSWVASANYGAPAEMAVRICAAVSLVVAVYAMYVSYVGITTVRPVMGVMRHSEWASYDFLTGLALAGSAATALMAANWRSRRMLLLSEVMSLLTLASSLVLATLTWALPPKMDQRMQQALCGGKYGDKVYGKEQHNQMCDQLPEMKSLVARSTSSLQWSATATAVTCLVLACLGMWYILELCFIEKKGCKHTRRHRRRRFTIPWEKIQIVGKPLPCGQGSGAAAHGAAAGAKAGGHCPFAHAPAAKNKSV